MLRARYGCAVLSVAVIVACHHASGSTSAGGSSRGGAARPNMLVSTAWLADHQRDNDVVILHVGRKAQYDSGHIVGARSVTLAEISAPASKLSLQMPTVDQLTAWANSNGIGDRTRIIVVPHDDTLQSAARVFLTLAYLGALERTSMLDGGFRVWRNEGRVVSTIAAAPAAPHAFTPHVRPELIATMAQVEQATSDGRVALVDARLSRFYNGDGGGYPRPGHIPTAVNIPFATVSDSGRFKAPAELRRMFVDAGVSTDKPVVTYCHIGQQASLLWFVATLIGYDARMFDGSFQEWSGTDRLPVIVEIPHVEACLGEEIEAASANERMQAEPTLPIELLNGAGVEQGIQLRAGEVAVRRIVVNLHQ